MEGFLNDAALSYLWQKIKSYVAQNAGAVESASKLKTERAIDGVLFDGTAARHHYATCSTSGATAAKTCSVTKFSLVTGARVTVRFAYANTAANPTLNVSGAGAKAIYYKGSPIPVRAIRQYTVLELVYSGTYWYVVGDLAGYQTELMESPYALYSSTSGIYPSAMQTWKYTTITGLSEWKEVRMYIEVGDGEKGYRTFTRDCPTSHVSAYAMASYSGCMWVTCDFTNNRVGVYIRTLGGWTYSNMRVLRVEGMVRNT